MNLAFFGDIVGRAGRDAFVTHLPGLRRKLKLDFVVVDAENAAGGFGLTEKIAGDLFDAGADCITLGNHAWDQREALSYIEREPRLLAPPQLSAPQSTGAGQGGLAVRCAGGAGAGGGACWGTGAWTPWTIRSRRVDQRPGRIRPWGWRRTR